MISRDELIEKARTAYRNWENTREDRRSTAEMVADFCLPLLAAERERAIEEADASVAKAIKAAREALGLIEKYDITDSYLLKKTRAALALLGAQEGRKT